MDAPEFMLIMAMIVLPFVAFIYLFARWFRLKERRLEVDAGLAVEKAAQYAASNAELEARVRVLEKIVTDGGMQTAAQIEALREQPRLVQGDKVQ